MPDNGDPHSGQLSNGAGRRQREGKVVRVSMLGYEKVEFCTHALDRMKQRRVTQTEVIDTIRQPVQTGLPTAPGRRRVRRPRSKTEAVDVVYIEQTDRIVVVTVIVIRLQRKRRRKQ